MPQTYEELMQEGERLREKEKDFRGAMEAFEQAYHLAQTPLQKGNAQSQVGLTQWHKEDYGDAGQTFRDLLAFGEENNEPNLTALAHRNLSRPEISWEAVDQVEHAEKAYEFAQQAGRSDLVWFAHGVLTRALGLRSQEMIVSFGSTSKRPSSTSCKMIPRPARKSPMMYFSFGRPGI